MKKAPAIISIGLALAAGVIHSIAQSPTPTPTPAPYVATALPTPTPRIRIAPQILSPSDALAACEQIAANGNTVMVSGSAVSVFPPTAIMITTGTAAGMVRLMINPTGR